MNLYLDTKLRPLINKGWEEYEVTNPEKATRPKSRFVFGNDLVKRLYSEEPDEVKREVERHRLKMRDGDDHTDDNAKNITYQRFVLHAISNEQKTYV